jgi:hypothetical protein
VHIGARLSRGAFEALLSTVAAHGDGSVRVRVMML